MTPVLCGSAFKNKGVQPLLDAVIDYLPSPLDVPPVEGLERPAARTARACITAREASDDEPFAALAFKVMADPYVGKLTYFRVYSGKLSAGGRVLNSITGRTERVGRILMMHANSREEQDEVYAGDIAAGVGLKQTSTGDTLSAPDAPVVLERMHVPRPGGAPLDRAEDQGRPGEAVHGPRAPGRGGPDLPGAHRRGDRPDRDLRHGRAAPRGASWTACKREFNVEAAVGRPQVAYRETVRGEAKKVEGKFIRQTGGSGQYGVVYIDLEPAPGEGFDFVNKIKGGSVPVGVHPRGREGDRGGARVRRQGRLPDGGRARDAHRRQVPRHGLVGDRLQDRRLAGAQGGRAAAPSPCCSSP